MYIHHLLVFPARYISPAHVPNRCAWFVSRVHLHALLPSPSTTPLSLARRKQNKVGNPNVVRSLEVALATTKELQPAIAWLVTKSLTKGLFTKATQDAKAEFEIGDHDACKLQNVVSIQKSNVAGPSLFLLIGSRYVWVSESTQEAKRRE